MSETMGNGDDKYMPDALRSLETFVDDAITKADLIRDGYPTAEEDVLNRVTAVVDQMIAEGEAEETNG